MCPIWHHLALQNNEDLPRLPRHEGRSVTSAVLAVNGMNPAWPNDMNGFMSTTLTRNVAMDYASSNDVADNPSLVFEIEMCMIDRGAPVKAAFRHFTF